MVKVKSEFEKDVEEALREFAEDALENFKDYLIGVLQGVLDKAEIK
jgi:hypothetical protein